MNANALFREDNEEYARLLQARIDFMNSLPPAERQARNNGEFFAFMHEVWDLEQVSIADNTRNLVYFKSIERNHEQGIRLYAQATSEENLSHPMSLSESSSVTNTDQRNPVRFDMFQNDTSERAHLGFSDASECHEAYGYLAQAATGKRVDTPQLRLKLLNGVKKSGKSRRSNGTGLKHHKFNKMYLERQGDYFDREMVLITIPIYGLDQVLNWNGTDAYNVLAITVGGVLGKSCAKKVLEAAPSLCDEGDIQMATELLRVFCLGIASSVRHHSVGESFATDQLDFHLPPMTNLKKWWKLKKEFLEGERASIQVPRLKDDLNWGDVKVARARASTENSLPDPYSMAVKAAVNFSAILGAKLMPACPEHSSSDTDGEMNSTQDEEDNQWPQTPRHLDLSSLLKPAQSAV